MRQRMRQRMRRFRVAALAAVLVAATLSAVPASTASAQTGLVGLPQVAVVTVPVPTAANQLTVNWQRAAGATGYKVQWRSGAQDWDAAGRQRTVAGGGTLTDTISDLDGGVDYHIRVIATGAGGAESEPSEAVTGRALHPRPQPPTDVAVSAIGNMRWLVTFTPSASAGVSHYVITYSYVRQRSAWPRNWVVRWSREHVVRSGDLASQMVRVGTAVRLRGTTQIQVRAVSSDAVGDGASADTDPVRVSGVPGFDGYRADPVADIHATKLDSDITVTWSAAARAEGYKVFYTKLDAATGTPEFHQHAPKVIAGGDTTTVALTSADGITADGIWRVWVLATSADSADSDFASPAYADTVPPALGGISARPAAGNLTGLAVSWDAHPGAESYEVSYRTAHPPDAEFCCTKSVTATNTTIANLTSETDYVVQVDAIDTDADPDRVIARGHTRATSGSTRPLKVAVPVPTEPNQLTVRWQEFPGASGYKVQWRSGAQSWDATARQRTVTGGDTLTDTIPDLDGGVTYWVRVIATRAGQADSDPSEVAGQEALHPAPAPPTNVKVTAMGTDRWLVTFTPSPTPGVTHYYVARWVTQIRLLFLDFVIHSGDLGQYAFRVAPFDRSNSSTNVIVKAVRPYSVGTGDSPYASNALVGGAANPVSDISAVHSGSTIHVSWTAAAAADGYKVFYTKLNPDTGTPEFIQHAPKVISGGDTTTAALTAADGIVAGHQYRIWVLATQAGVGDSWFANPSHVDVGLRFVIYHDPDAGPAAVNRYNQAIALLARARSPYSEVQGDLGAEVSRLAGVDNSVMPRFFLGDPHHQGWVSEPRVNNGGLRWLKQKLAELNGEPANEPEAEPESPAEPETPAEPEVPANQPETPAGDSGDPAPSTLTVSIEAPSSTGSTDGCGTWQSTGQPPHHTAPVVVLPGEDQLVGCASITEGRAAVFTIALSGPASQDLRIPVVVGDAAGSNFLHRNVEGCNIVRVPAGTQSVQLGIPTRDDANDEPDGAIWARLNDAARIFKGVPDPTGYTLDSQNTEAKININDNDDPATTRSAPPPASDQCRTIN